MERLVIWEGCLELFAVSLKQIIDCIHDKPWMVLDIAISSQAILGRVEQTPHSEVGQEHSCQRRSFVCGHVHSGEAMA